VDPGSEICVKRLFEAKGVLVEVEGCSSVTSSLSSVGFFSLPFEGWVKGFRLRLGLVSSGEGSSGIVDMPVWIEDQTEFNDESLECDV
jgi:hypothetical protein